MEVRHCDKSADNATKCCMNKALLFNYPLITIDYLMCRKNVLHDNKTDDTTKSHINTSHYMSIQILSKEDRDIIK